jgi:hypothetical protein
VLDCVCTGLGAGALEGLPECGCEKAKFPPYPPFAFSLIFMRDVTAHLLSLLIVELTNLLGSRISYGSFRIPS